MFMLGNTDTETNQTPGTINLPDRLEGVESPPQPPAPQKPDEHVPPVEVPGRQDTPEHVPEKSAAWSGVFPVLVKNGRKTG